MQPEILRTRVEMPFCAKPVSCTVVALLKSNAAQATYRTSAAGHRTFWLTGSLVAVNDANSRTRPVCSTHGSDHCQQYCRQREHPLFALYPCMNVHVSYWRVCAAALRYQSDYADFAVVWRDSGCTASPGVWLHFWKPCQLHLCTGKCITATTVNLHNVACFVQHVPMFPTCQS